MCNGLLLSFRSAYLTFIPSNILSSKIQSPSSRLETLGAGRQVAVVAPVVVAVCLLPAVAAAETAEVPPVLLL